MKHRIVVRYPFAPAMLLRALTTPQFHVDKAYRLGAACCDLLDQKVDGSSMAIRIRRRMPNTAPVPRALAKLIPNEIVVEHRDQWDASSGRGLIEVQVDRMPVRLIAKASVFAIATGCVQQFDWEINSSLPLLGGTLERFIAQDLDRSIQEETRVIEDLLTK